MGTLEQSLLVGMLNGAATVENRFVLPQKVKHRIPYDPASVFHLFSITHS